MRKIWLLMLLLLPVLSDDTTQDPDHDHDHHDHHDDDHHHHEEEESWKTMKLGTWGVVGCSTLSVLTISVLPAILLFFIPVKNPNSQLLKFLLAFGAGGLLGDAILHIIPHAMIGHSHGAHEHEHEHEHEHAEGNVTDDHHHEEAHAHEHEAHDHSRELMVGLYVIAGILIFMVFEQVTRIFRNATNHSQNEQVEKAAGSTPIPVAPSSQIPTENEQKSSVQQSVKEDEKGRIIRSSAYLNLVADFLHNITDGFAIGASFSINLYTGLMITGSVFVHEIPHEIGDFAILVRSGFTKFQAIGLQFVTALGALCGCYFAIWLADSPDDVKDQAAKSWIMPLTAGGFIYIATVSVLPEILEANPEYSLRKQILHGILITLFFLVGIGLMYLVAYFE